MISAREILRRYVWPAEPARVANQHLALGMFYLWVGGMMAMNLRYAQTFPGRVSPFLGPILFWRTGGVVGPTEYAGLLALHGTAMIFFALSPIVIGWLGYLTLAPSVGAKSLAFPTWGRWAFWLNALGAMVLLGGMYEPYGGPYGGWTSYPPLSERLGSQGPAQTFLSAAMVLQGLSAVLTATNFVVTVLRGRAPGMTLFRMPLTAWGLFLSSTLTVLFAPVALVATVLLLADRHLGTTFFLAGMSAGNAQGDPLLYQHLFWVFGHPEVYIVILPVWGVVSDVLPTFARKPAFGYRSTAWAMCAVTVLSGTVYGHHLFAVGLRPLAAEIFSALTASIAVPSSVFFLNWLGTLWRGSLRFKGPLLYALAVLVVFSVGGLSGAFLAAVTTDVYLHETLFVVGHFHFVMAAAVLLGAFCALHFWFPIAFGKKLSERAARWHFGLSLPLMVGAFGGMMVLGWSGFLRRSFHPDAVYDYVRPLAGLNRFVAYCAFGLFLAQFIFLGNVLYSLWRGERVSPGENPWNATTLDWVPLREGETVVREPHEFSRDGKDFAPQAGSEP